MKKILIAGGSGLIGTRLSQHLTKMGFEVAWLSRSRRAGDYPTYLWDLQRGELESEALRDLWAVINLAGAGIVDRSWTPRQKDFLRHSRVDGNALLLEKIRLTSDRPQVYVGASAIGLYGNQIAPVTEESEMGDPNLFLVQLCRDWEASTEEATSLGMRRVVLRIGVVLSTEGGFLPSMKKTMPLGIATYFDSGRQGVSWIHVDDLCRLIIHTLTGSATIYNSVAPNPTVFKEMTAAIARHKGLGINLPLPSQLLKWVMGERHTAILQNLQALPTSATNEGFQFEYPDLASALDSLM